MLPNTSDGHQGTKESEDYGSRCEFGIVFIYCSSLGSPRKKGGGKRGAGYVISVTYTNIQVLIPGV